MNDKIKDIITKIELGRTGFCGLDSLIRIDNKDLGNLDNYCENCLFREKLDSVVCPYRMMNTRGRRVLL